MGQPLTTMSPGEGYLFRRQSEGTVEMRYYKPSVRRSARRAWSEEPERDVPVLFTNHQSATNMTIVAKIDDATARGVSQHANTNICVYAGGSIAGISVAQDVNGEMLYFITVSSNNTGEQSFVTTSVLQLTADDKNISYEQDAHIGTVGSPMILRVSEAKGEEQSQKCIIDGILYIFRGGRIYNAQGMLVNEVLMR